MEFNINFDFGKKIKAEKKTVGHYVRINYSKFMPLWKLMGPNRDGETDSLSDGSLFS